jgi:predicted ThiF/HesA family dinucleotide-utilizing enzyme
MPQSTGTLKLNYATATHLMVALSEYLRQVEPDLTKGGKQVLESVLEELLRITKETDFGY